MGKELHKQGRIPAELARQFDEHIAKDQNKAQEIADNVYQMALELFCTVGPDLDNNDLKTDILEGIREALSKIGADEATSASHIEQYELNQQMEDTFLKSALRVATLILERTKIRKSISELLEVGEEEKAVDTLISETFEEFFAYSYQNNATIYHTMMSYKKNNSNSRPDAKLLDSLKIAMKKAMINQGLLPHPNSAKKESVTTGESNASFGPDIEE